MSASSKTNRFMGTYSAYENLRSEPLAVHTYTLLGADVVDGADCFVVDAKPATERQAADSGYSRRKIWIRKDHYVTVKREFYDRQDRLEKVQTNPKPLTVPGT